MLKIRDKDIYTRDTREHLLKDFIEHYNFRVEKALEDIALLLRVDESLIEDICPMKKLKDWVYGYNQSDNNQQYIDLVYDVTTKAILDLIAERLRLRRKQ